MITDPAQFPKVFKESPEFAQQVASGALPKVADRIGRDPLVIKPVHETGKYGGVIRRAFIGTGDIQNGMTLASGPDNLLYFDAQGKKVIPNIARAFEMSADQKVLTLHLRRGMRWSDGEPLTADDILFWSEDIDLHPDLGVRTKLLFSGGQRVLVKKIDDFTVQYVAGEPNPFLPGRFAAGADLTFAAGYLSVGSGAYAPKHYLSRFHPKYSSVDTVDRAAKAAGFKGWVTYFQDRCKWYTNPELPSTTPWVTTRPMNTPPWELSANPYSIWVDTDGNQLPYIGKITMSNVENREVVVLHAGSGDYDVQDRQLDTSSLPVLLQNQPKGQYTIHRAPSSDMDYTIRINLAYAEDNAIGDLLRTTDFRRALSLGIRRDEINEAFFLGLSKPSATIPPDDSPYFPGPEWRTKWATYDPDQANQLLDKLGLTQRDSAGYRRRADGRGRIQLDYQSTDGRMDFTGMGEMIKRQWSKIGIDLTVRSISPALLIQRAVANELMISGFFQGVDDPFLATSSGLLPLVTNAYAGMIGIPYGRWFGSDGKAGVEPPASLQALKDAMDLYTKADSVADEAERNRMGQELFKLCADQVFTIGVLGFGLAGAAVHLAKNDLGNVPARMVNSVSRLATPLNSLPMTFYHK
ncbi:ABC transporter substrate-binding protein [Kribbella sp. NPDC049227]|uniref:ABC transporter substrate-binding protein n=1 Tax=Kribbella sp. NPDC049227 TaxID=3364113 RepID=UPI00371DC1A5